jgi:hypothetical protein
MATATAVIRGYSVLCVLSCPATTCVRHHTQVRSHQYVEEATAASSPNSTSVDCNEMLKSVTISQMWRIDMNASIPATATTTSMVHLGLYLSTANAPHLPKHKHCD